MRLLLKDLLFDSGARVLLRDGRPVALSPKAYCFLEMLLERRPNAVSKAELDETLWPSSFVSEGSLAVLAAEVRRALGDDAHRARFIRTVHRYGYAFAGEAAPADTRETSHHIVFERRELPLVPGENVLGRDPDCAVVVDRTTVSRRHARIVVEASGARFEDLGSKNGSFHRGRRVTQPVPLADGDEIGLGSVLLRFAHGSPQVSTRTDPDGGS